LDTAAIAYMTDGWDDDATTVERPSGAAAVKPAALDHEAPLSLERQIWPSVLPLSCE
jgi:hypothetical protein